MRNKLVIFSFIGSTIAPAILATTHFPFPIALFSFILAFSVVIMTYFLVKVEWKEGGLSIYVERIGKIPYLVFIVSWITSYYLYVIYTVVYIPYYVLNLDGLEAIILTVIISVSVYLLAIMRKAIYAFPFIFFSQVALVLPIGWRVSISHVPLPITSLFTNILSSSLITVCITLSTFINGDKSFSNYIPIAYMIGGSMLFYSSFLSPNIISSYGVAIGNYGLILAELYALNNLLEYRGISTKVRGLLNTLIIPFSLIGNLNYSLFYNTLIVPSLVALYLSLSVLSFSSVKLLGKLLLPATLTSLALFIYGEYAILSSSFEAIISILLILFVIIIMFLFERKLGKVL